MQILPPQLAFLPALFIMLTHAAGISLHAQSIVLIMTRWIPGPE